MTGDAISALRADQDSNLHSTRKGSLQSIGSSI